jgi:hypothetical protein
VEEPLNSGEPAPEAAAPDPAPPPAWHFAFDRERHRRRALLRRLAALLGTGTLAFTLTTWLLLRHESRAPRPVPADPLAAKTDGTPKDSSPAPGEQAAGAALRIARAQLEALNQDDVSGAYSYFSPAYRARVPLATFRRLVRAHRDMFHTEEQDVNTRSQSADRVVLEIHVSSDDGEDYVAQFTLARLNGKWCVDNLRWGFDEGDSHSSA